MKSNDRVKKIIHKSKIAISACSLVACVFAVGTKSVSAQSSMSGGGYTLNGGISITNASLSGGGYTLSPGAEGVIGSASGGGYVLNPTPFPSGSTGQGVSVSADDAIRNTGGYTYYPSATSTYMQSESVLDPRSLQQGVFWIDQGNGVDTDLDGVPDSYGSGSIRADSYAGNEGISKEDASNSGDDTNSPSIKVYENNLNSFQSILLWLFILCAVFCRIIRRHTLDGVQIHSYRISRMPIAIAIDLIVALHKNHTDLQSIPMRDLKAEGSLHSLPPRDSRSRSSTLGLLDCIITPVLALFCMAMVWPISSVLSLIFGFVIIIRLYIGKRLLSDM